MVKLLHRKFKTELVLRVCAVVNPVCFLEAFTADHKPLMGESPEVRGFFLGCGFNSSGMMLSKYVLDYCNTLLE